MNHNPLETRLNKLEQRVKILEKKISPQANHVETTITKSKNNTHTNTHPQEPIWIKSLTHWLKEDWLMKLGATLLILALVWFVTYTFANNWIGPIGRISLGIIAGITILGTGNYFIPKKRVPGEVLVVTGMTMLILTIFAGVFFYDFFSNPLALGMMTLIMTLSASISILHKSKSVAITSVIASGLVPILLGGFGELNNTLLLLYLLIVNLGVLAVVSIRSWRSLIILSLIISSIYATGAFDIIENTGNNLEIWIFMGIFYFLFLISNFSAIWKTKSANTTDIFVAGLNSFVALGWIYLFVPENWQSITLSFLAILSIIFIAFMLRNLKDLKRVIFIYGGTAFAFIIAATIFELKEYSTALIIIFSIEIMLATLFTIKYIKDFKAASNLSLLQIIPILLLITNKTFIYHSWENIPVINEHSVSIGIIILALFTTAYSLSKKARKATLIHYSLASILTVLLIWFSLFNLINNFDIARGVALITYTLIGVTLMFISHKKDSKILKIGSNILLIFVVLRLFLFEFWEMPISGKVITSFLVGTLLIGTAFFNKKLITK